MLGLLRFTVIEAVGPPPSKLKVSDVDLERRYLIAASADGAVRVYMLSPPGQVFFPSQGLFGLGALALLVALSVSGEIPGKQALA